MATQVQERGITGSLAYTPSDTVNLTALQMKSVAMLRVNCTVAGNVTVILLDGSTEVIAVGAGYAVFPYEVLRVMVTGTTATATYAALLRPQANF